MSPLPADLVRYLPQCACRSQIKLRALVQINGSRQYAIYCFETGWRGSFIPHEIANRVAAGEGWELERIPVFKDNRRGCCSGAGCADCVTYPCARCGSYEQVQYHHWAPHFLFDDADRWPTSFLCAPCHRKWHTIVTPRMHVRQAG